MQLENFYMIYLTAIGQPPGGSCSVHIYTQTIQETSQNKQYKEHKNTQNNKKKNTQSDTTTRKSAGRVPSLRGFTLVFALQLRKKHGKTSVRVVIHKHTLSIHSHTIKIHKLNCMQYVENLIFKSNFPTIISVSLLHMLYRKIHSKFIHTILYIFVHSSIGVFNHTLPACKRKFYRCCPRRMKVERACLIQGDRGIHG